MSNLANLALVIDATVYIVDNGIRRGVLTIGANVQSTENQVQESSRTLDPNETWVFNCLPVNKGTIIRVQNGPVNVQFTKGAEVWTQPVASLHIDTDQIDAISFINPPLSARTVFVRVIQA